MFLVNCTSFKNDIFKTYINHCMLLMWMKMYYLTCTSIIKYVILCYSVHLFNICQVKPADAGEYTCRLEFQGGSSLTAKLNLTVLNKDGAASSKHNI